MTTWDEWKVALSSTRAVWRAVEGPRLRGAPDAWGLPCTQPVQGLAWSSDGRRVAVAAGGSVASADGLVAVAEPDTGRTWLLHGHVRGTHGVAFDPRTGLLATAGHDGAVGLWDLATGEGFPIPGPRPRQAVAFAGSVLIVGDELPHSGERSLVTRLDLGPPWGRRDEALPDDTMASGLVVSPDGLRVLVHRFHREGAHGFECRTMADWGLVWAREAVRGELVNGLAWAQADTVVRSISDASRERRLERVDAATGEVRQQRIVGRTMLGGIDVDASRGRVATIGNEGTLALWSLADLEPLGAGELGEWPATRVALSPDGRRVAVGSATDQGVWILTLP